MEKKNLIAKGITVGVIAGMFGLMMYNEFFESDDYQELGYTQNLIQVSDPDLKKVKEEEPKVEQNKDRWEPLIDLSEEGIEFEVLLEEIQHQMASALRFALYDKDDPAKGSLDSMIKVFNYIKEHHDYNNDDVLNLMDMVWVETCESYDHEQYKKFHWTLKYMYAPYR